VVLFKFRAGIGEGANLLSAGIYPLRGWQTLFVFVSGRHAVTLRLPVRSRLHRHYAAGMK
jgi:hypothetical protein